MLIPIERGFLGAYGTLPPSVNKVWNSRRGSGGKPQHYKNPRCKEWEKAFRASFETAPRNRIPGPWSLSLLWLVSDARSDVDNRPKLILDALEGILYPNDVGLQSVNSRKALLKGGRKAGFLFLFGAAESSAYQAEVLARFVMPEDAISSRPGWLASCIDALKAAL